MGVTIVLKSSASLSENSPEWDEIMQYLESMGASHIRKRHPDVLPGIWSASIPDDAKIDETLTTLRKMNGIEQADVDMGRTIM